jgi:hypothetical protein
MSTIQFPVIGTELRIQMVETRWQVNCQDCPSNQIFSNHLLGQIGVTLCITTLFMFAPAYLIYVTAIDFLFNRHSGIKEF